LRGWKQRCPMAL